MLLAKDGIFPITTDKDGRPIGTRPASGLSVPGTIQGEGKLCGIPSLFIRLAGCNLRCCWQTTDGSLSPCDTLYASYELRETTTYTVDDICRTVLQNSRHLRHLVLTGGEPLLQAMELKELCMRLKSYKDFHLTLETNATLFDPEIAAFIDLFSLSPKLSSACPAGTAPGKYLKPVIIQAFIDYARQHEKDFQLKFVHAAPKDIPEIRQLLTGLQGWNNDDILLMPAGGNPELQAAHRRQTLACCIENGWRYCDRLHLTLFGDRAGV